VVENSRVTARRLFPSCVVLVAAGLLAAGCGGEGQNANAAPPTVAELRQRPSPQQPPPPPPAVKPARQCAGEQHSIGNKSVAYAAAARRPTIASRRPGKGRLASFGVKNVNGHVTVFGVRRAVLDAACEIGWYRVALPMRPNGIQGYVDADDVRLYRVRSRIVVDLSRRTLTLYRVGHRALRATVAVGAPATPTPVGRYYVDQRLIAGNPNGPWGPAAIGISAHSDVLTDWPQGGPIAIHGTNDPSSIGRAVSHGCVRLPNTTLRRIFAVTEAGSPVIIQA
jgi:hypothetical protein